MRTLTPFAAAALMLAAGPAFAQTATPAADASTTAAPAAAAAPAKAPATGQTVYDTANGVVGTIASVDAANAVIDTGTNKVALPLSSYAMGANGPVIAMTKAQVDAAAAGATAQAAAKTAASVTAGASVKDTSGASVGTIKSIEGEYALLDTSKVQVKLPISAFAVQGEGLVVGMSKTQIEAAAGTATPPAPR